VAATDRGKERMPVFGATKVRTMTSYFQMASGMVEEKEFKQAK
jgi:hypothetical protein